MRKTLAITLLAGAALVMGPGSASAIDQWPDTGWSNSDCFNNSGDPIACDGSEGYPGQDGSHNAPARDFTDNGDGTVTDNVTGLMWVQDGGAGDPMLTWQEAVDFAASLDFATHDDWRLPTVAELATLVDSSAFNPALTDYGTTFINSPAAPSVLYWSMTDNVNDVARAWVVNFTNGDIGVPYYVELTHTPLKTDANYVRAVRDVQ